MCVRWCECITLSECVCAMCACASVCVKCAWRCWHCCLATMFSFFSASQGFLLLFFSLFFIFFFSYCSAAGGWCHEQTSGILANKLDLPRHTQRHTHTDTLTHSTRPPYTGGKTAATRRKTANLKLLASCGSLWLPGFHHPPASQPAKPSTSTVPSQAASTSQRHHAHPRQLPTVSPVSPTRTT